MKESKLSIGIDCDDVLVATAEKSVAFFNERYGNHLTLDDMFQMPTIEKYGTTDIRIVLARVAEFTQEMAGELPLIDGAYDAIDGWKRQGVGLHMITGRSAPTQDATLQALRRDFCDAFTSYEFTDSLNPETKRSKRDVCLELGTVAMIDDLIINDLPGATTGMVFGNYPWNRNKDLPDNAVRVPNWEVARDKVEELLWNARQ
ncbi:MAG: HAD family hydrolase [Candidatus Saccharimonadales bacterium]